MDEISYSGQLTQNEVAAAFYMGGPLGRWNISGRNLVIGLAAVAVLLTLAYSGVSGAQIILYIASCFIPLFFIAAIYYLAPSVSAKKAFTSGSEFKNPFSGVVSDEGIMIQSTLTRGQSQWSIFRFARVSPGFVLLYSAANIFNVFPRKFFATEADWLAFRSLVARKVAKKYYHKKDPTAPLFSRQAEWLTYGISILFVVLLIYYFISRF